MAVESLDELLTTIDAFLVSRPTNREFSEAKEAVEKLLKDANMMRVKRFPKGSRVVIQIPRREEFHGIVTTHRALGIEVEEAEDPLNGTAKRRRLVFFNDLDHVHFSAREVSETV